jgi:hypothetical protein
MRTTSELTRLALEGYRLRVLEALKRCVDSGGVMFVMTIAAATLRKARLSLRARQAFWQDLHAHLHSGPNACAHIETGVCRGNGELAATARATIAVHLRVPAGRSNHAPR